MTTKERDAEKKSLGDRLRAIKEEEKAEEEAERIRTNELFYEHVDTFLKIVSDHDLFCQGTDEKPKQPEYKGCRRCNLLYVKNNGRWPKDITIEILVFKRN